MQTASDVKKKNKMVLKIIHATDSQITFKIICLYLICESVACTFLQFQTVSYFLSISLNKISKSVLNFSKIPTLVVPS